MSVEFGAQCVVCAIDARRRPVRPAGGDGVGGLHPRRPDADRPSTSLAWVEEAERRGAGEILLTSMDRDGTKEGYDLELTRAVSDATGVPVIASGGVGTLQHLVEGSLEGGADAVLAASIFHFGEHDIAEAKALLARCRHRRAPGLSLRDGTVASPWPAVGRASSPSRC